MDDYLGVTILSWFNLAFAALLTFTVIFWWNSLRARELALKHARKACNLVHLQLLDQTVALQRLSIKRSDRGRLCIERHYRFEYTEHGTHRDTGTVSMRGHALHGLSLPYTRDDDGNRVFLQ